MTQLQLTYWENQRKKAADAETARHNLAFELESARHNRTTEAAELQSLGLTARANAEKERANKAGEALRGLELAESERANKMRESLTLAAQNETERHNKRGEELSAEQLKETKRSNQMDESIRWNTLAENIRANKERERENHRANVEKEANNWQSMMLDYNTNLRRLQQNESQFRDELQHKQASLAQSEYLHMYDNLPKAAKILIAADKTGSSVSGAVDHALQTAGDFLDDYANGSLQKELEEKAAAGDKAAATYKGMLDSIVGLEKGSVRNEHSVLGSYKYLPGQLKQKDDESLLQYFTRLYKYFFKNDNE